MRLKYGASNCLRIANPEERGDFLMMSGSQVSIGVGTPGVSGGVSQGKTIIH